MYQRPHKQRGFTLIELMITVAIIAILAAVAYPAYTQYVLRGNRSEGIAQLSDAAARMERYYAQNNSYKIGTDLTKIGITTSASTTGKYALSVSSNDTSYKLTSTPQDNQANDTCGTLTLDQAGAKTPTTAECWK